MAIDVSTADGVTIFNLIGRLDSNSAGEAEQTVIEAVDGGATRIIFDFRDLDYISSAGLRVILVAAKRMKAAGGKLTLCGMQEHVEEVFEMSGFLAILTVCPDRQAALQAMTA
jgi:anti-anti-sigma factor